LTTPTRGRCHLDSHLWSTRSRRPDGRRRLPTRPAVPIRVRSLSRLQVHPASRPGRPAPSDRSLDPRVHVRGDDCATTTYYLLWLVELIRKPDCQGAGSPRPEGGGQLASVVRARGRGPPLTRRRPRPAAGRPTRHGRSPRRSG
jgi:hypothetical protein